ncbi:MAG TPA: DsbA family protein [Thermoleophilaceae bacterium]|nr:DsbA family protein [Thermoleophilaceae bacterium]
MADVRITEFTDPGCPWAWSSEPFRRRLNWLYGDSVEWDVRLVVLAESPSEYEERGFDPTKQARSFQKISSEHGMPIDTRERPRMAATIPACRAVVAVRRHDRELMPGLLRRLRVRHFAGELLDEQSTLEHAARDIGLDLAQLDEWMAEPDTERELRDDMELARGPMPAARVLDHKLANWSGGRRYTCPSYEIVRQADRVRIAVPGFQPFGVYDVITANLVPDSERREDPESVEEVLEWCATPLATQEVAVVCDISHDEAREQLGRVADEQHMGYDGFWTLNGS